MGATSRSGEAGFGPPRRAGRDPRFDLVAAGTRIESITGPMNTGRAVGRSGLRRAAVACALLVLLALPGGAGGSGSRPHAPRATITVASLAVEPGALGFYAKHRGFFARQGLDANVRALLSPDQLIALLASGDAEFVGFNVGGAAILKSRKLPFKVVAAGAIARRAVPTSSLVAAKGKSITRARDLVGRRIAIDQANTIAHIGLLKWLKRGGVSASEVELVEIRFADMPGPLLRGTVDAAVLPEPFLTYVTERGAKPIASFVTAVCPADCLITVWMARKDISSDLAARFRNAIQAAAVWANKPKNDRASGAILARYVPFKDKSVIAKMKRTRFAERLRPAQAQPWIDAYAEFGAIPESFPAIELVK
jgi:NitT/TauT family transport system substrate-binding protein